MIYGRTCNCTGFLSTPGGVCCMVHASPQQGAIGARYLGIHNGEIFCQQDVIDAYPQTINQKQKEEKPYNNIFEFVAVDPKRRDDIRHVKNALYDLYCWILDNVQENKYRSNGIDLLEAAAMQFNKAISRRIDNEGNDGKQKGKR